MTLLSNSLQMPQRYAQRGLTLLELLVVLAVLALSLMLVSPNFRGVNERFSLEQTARLMASSLNDARSQAIRRNRENVFSINLQDYKFSAIGARTHSFANDIDINIIAARSELMAEGNPAIRFYPDGSATGGEITLAKDGASYLIKVDWLTGAIEIEQLERSRP